MKNILFILLIALTITSCGKKEETITPITSTGTIENKEEIVVNNSGSENMTATGETQEQINNSGSEVVNNKEENLLPINEKTTEAEKELSNELDSLLNSIDETSGNEMKK